jgi:hypothetical protein
MSRLRYTSVFALLRRDKSPRQGTRRIEAAVIRLKTAIFGVCPPNSRPTNFHAPKSDKECETKVWAGRPNQHASRVRSSFLFRSADARLHNPTSRRDADRPTTDGRANLPVCSNLTASQRSNAGGTMGIRTPEHRSARSGESLGGAAAPPYPGGGVKLRPVKHHLTG